MRFRYARTALKGVRSEMNMTEYKPLQPLPFGNILIVGGKASNFDDELKTHPRVICGIVSSSIGW